MGFIKIVKLFKRRLCYLKIFSYLCIVIDLELMPYYTIYNSLIFTSPRIPVDNYCPGGLVPSYLYFSCPHLLHPAAGGCFLTRKNRICSIVFFLF